MVASKTRIYRVKGISGLDTHMRVLRENDEGFEILITTRTESRTRTSQEFISRSLLDSCLRTGYLLPVDDGAPVLSAAAVSG